MASSDPVMNWTLPGASSVRKSPFSVIATGTVRRTLKSPSRVNRYRAGSPSETEGDIAPTLTVGRSSSSMVPVADTTPPPGVAFL